MELINNRLVNLWRGTLEPPTKYHIWIKDNKLLLYNGEKWMVFVDNFSTISELKLAIEDLENSTVNGKAIKTNPILTSLDILIGKDLDNFKAEESIIKVLESLDLSYTEGYPIKVIENSDGTITITFGNHDFKLKATGESLSIRALDNTIIFDSDALTLIPTESPLEWTKERKLIHQDSGVLEGVYGTEGDLSNASTIKIPNVTVDKKGHITDILNTTVTVRDYVKLLKPDDNNSESKPVLLAYDSKQQEQSNPVRQASGLSYNDSTGELNVRGIAVVGKGIKVIGGDLVVEKGFKIYGEVYGDVQGSAIPKIHSAVTPEYGAASTSLYGHVIVVDELGETAPPPSNTNNSPDKLEIATGTLAVAASPLMVWNALEKSKKYAKEMFSDDFEEINNKFYLRWEEI